MESEDRPQCVLVLDATTTVPEENARSKGEVLQLAWRLLDLESDEVMENAKVWLK